MYEIKGKYTSAKIFTESEDIEVTEQTRAVCNHHIFKDCQIRIMPDCHKGKGCTIGFTAEMPKNGEIIPNIIGVDQFCGMHVIKLSDNDITNDYEKLEAEMAEEDLANLYRKNLSKKQKRFVKTF